jgi:hypothetical protein
MLRTLTVLAFSLLSTASTWSQSLSDRVPLLSDTAKVGIPAAQLKRWAVNRTIDRRSLRSASIRIVDLEGDLSIHRAKDIEQEKERKALSDQLRVSQGESAERAITIMNQASTISGFAAKAVWALVGKVGTAVIAVGVVVVAIVVVKETLTQ